MGSKLSGGQKQRLALARTFYNNSQVIILDEPTSALDSTTELNIVKRLREISKNKIIIFFTHNENLKRYFNEVYIIKNQKIKKYENYFSHRCSWIYRFSCLKRSLEKKL